MNNSTRGAAAAAKVAGKGKGWILFMALWVVTGLLAVPTSIYCMAARPTDQSSGGSSSDLIGILLAVLFGPLYFIWFYMKKGYCQAR